MKADIDTLDHRPNGKYCIQDKKGQYESQSCQQVFSLSFFTHLISSLQLPAHDSFAVCKGKESLMLPLLCPAYLRKIRIKFVVKHTDCLFCVSIT